jgi:tetratricopeptide (TPR) repeat protein
LTASKARRRARRAAAPAARTEGRAPAAPASRAARWIWAAAAAAVALRAGLLAQVHDHPLLRPTGVLDDAEYFRLAQRAAAGDWLLGPGAFYVSPLYIYFLAVVFRVAGAAPIHAQGVQVLLGGAAVALIGRAGARLFGPRAGAIAAGLAALTGVLAFNEVLLLQSALDPFLSALALERLSAALVRGGPPRFAAAGAALALLALNRPNALLALAVVVLAVLAAGRSRAAVRQAALLAAGAALVLAPVAVRNRIASGEWVLVASHGGLNFYIGNNPQADGSYAVPAGVAPTIQGQSADTRRIAEAAAGRALSDAEVSDHFYGLGWRWIRDRPAAAGRLFLRKLALTLNAAELPLNYSYAYWSRDERTLLRFLVVGSWLLLPLGLAGLFVPSRLPAGAFAVWASFVPAYAVAVAAFFVASRYRLPLLVALCVTAAATLEWAWRAVAAKALPARARAVAAASVVGALLALWPLGADDGVADERTERIVHLIGEGRGGEAEALLERTVPLHRDPGLLHYRVGRAWLDAGRAEAAAASFQRALERAPEQGEVHLALGQALVRLGRAAQARAHLERARAAGAFLDVAGLELARALAAAGDAAGARAVLAGTPLLADTDVTTATALGVVAVTLGEPAAALRFLDRALTLDEGAADAHEHRGLALEQLGRRGEAVRALQTAVRLAPSDPSAHYNLALLLAREGRLDAARAVAARALALDPGSRATRELIAALDGP